MSELKTIKITYRDGAYRVSEPNWDGGEVVMRKSYDELRDLLERLANSMECTPWAFRRPQEDAYIKLIRDTLDGQPAAPVRLRPGTQPPDFLARLMLRYWGVGDELDSDAKEILMFALANENKELNGTIHQKARELFKKKFPEKQIEP